MSQPWPTLRSAGWTTTLPHGRGSGVGGSSSPVITTGRVPVASTLHSSRSTLAWAPWSPKSFARIHRRNLLSQGILPLVFDSEADYDRLRLGDWLKIREVRGALERGESIIHARVGEAGEEVSLRSEFSAHERHVLLAGGLLALSRSRGAQHD